MTDTKNTKAYSEKVEQARKMARDIIRMKKINNNKQRTFGFSQALLDIDKALEKIDMPIKRVQYKLTQLDTANPDYEDLKKELDATLEEVTKMVENDTKYYTEQKETYEKKIAETKENIAKWERGENKVSIDEVKQIADQIIDGTIQADSMILAD